ALSHAQLDTPAHARGTESMCEQSRVDVFASSHTCLPALRRFDFGGRPRAVANNGAAGMPNFSGTRYGVVTRIGRRPFAGPETLCGVDVAGARVEAIALGYD